MPNPDKMSSYPSLVIVCDSGIILSTVPTTPLLCMRTEVGHFFIKPKRQQVMSFELHSITCDQTVSVKFKGVLKFSLCK